MVQCTKNKIRLLQRIRVKRCSFAGKLSFVIPAKAGIHHRNSEYLQPVMDPRLRGGDDVFKIRVLSLRRFVDYDPLKTLIVMIGRTELAFDHRCTFEIMTDGQLLRNANATMRLNRILTDKVGTA
jgi:hypothetical protein